MKANQKLYTKEGVQVALFPMQYLRATQWDGEGTHTGTNALDNAGKDGGCDPIFAPCDLVCTGIWGAEYGHNVFFQTLDKIQTPSGLQHLTLMTLHDDVVDVALNGIYVQGTKIGDEGNTGKSFGNHSHLEVAFGHQPSQLVQNGQGVWHLPNNVSIEDAVYFNDTEVLAGSASFKIYNDGVTTPPNKTGGDTLNSIPSDFEEQQGTFTVNAELPIVIRKAPSTNGADTGYQYENGNSVNYDGFVRREGYIWISWISLTDGTRRWMASGKTNSQGVNVEPWGTFK